MIRITTRHTAITFMTFEEFQEQIVAHPLVGGQDWVFEKTRYNFEVPQYKGSQPKRVGRGQLQLEIRFWLDESRWLVSYYHQGTGDSLDQALRDFFAMDSTAAKLD